MLDVGGGHKGGKYVLVRDLGNVHFWLCFLPEHLPARHANRP